MTEKLYTKTKLSALVGFTESNGRRWIKKFKEYIPSIENGNRIMYTVESVRVLNIIKKMHETGLSLSAIQTLIQKDGLPNDETEISRIKTDKNFSVEIADTLPSTKEMLIPYLVMIKNRKAYSASEITEKLIKYFNLTDEQRQIRYENTSDSILLSRIRSARYSLKKEGYIDEVNKLTYQITNDGLELLRDTDTEIEEEIEELGKVVNPITIVKEKLDELENELADTLLKQLQNIHWMKFEDIVVELLTVMGYGDGKVNEQRTNDEGIDCIIKEDKLGLDNIYVQAKRYSANNSIGREMLQNFAGALDGKGARKGVFITTSYFTDGAKKFAKRIEPKKIILIDGIELSKLMITYNVGVDITHTFTLKDINYDYFKDE